MHKMRRFRQELSLEETKRIFEEGTFGVLALCGEDLNPYAVPISYVYDGDKIYFHSAKAGHKLEIIKNNANASFTVIDQNMIVPEKYTTYFRSAITFGEIRILDNQEEMIAAMVKLGMKYSSDFKEGIMPEIQSQMRALCVLEFNIERMSGKEAIELVREREMKK